MAPTVDGREERVDRAQGRRGPDPPCGVFARSERSTEGIVHEGSEAVVERLRGGRVGAKIGRILLGWDRSNGDRWESVRKTLTDYWVAWKCAVKDGVDECLCGKVCDCLIQGQGYAYTWAVGLTGYG